mmetsp:Transcript_13857/g.39432  ORF Transcript_13857/g.39432 Transcript_13857/m.39432 type:complete len:87 (-) Transcript_13857:570-830(-)
MLDRGNYRHLGSFPDEAAAGALGLTVKRARRGATTQRKRGLLYPDSLRIVLYNETWEEEGALALEVTEAFDYAAVHEFLHDNLQPP